VSVCLYVCMSVSLSDDNTVTFESLDTGSSFAHPEHLDLIRVKFVYEGHRVKVKVTGAKQVETPYSRNVKFHRQ